MKLSNLERVHDHEVERWLIEKLQLNDYQKSKLHDSDLIRCSHLYFYKKSPKKSVSFLWRLSIIFFLPYYLLLVLFSPIKWIITGKGRYSEKFFDNFHAKWIRKIGLS